MNAKFPELRHFAEIDEAQPEPEPDNICPNCGRTGGDPVRLGTGETSSTTGYCDEGEGCTLCDPRRERAQPFEVQEDGDVTF